MRLVVDGDGEVHQVPSLVHGLGYLALEVDGAVAAEQQALLCATIHRVMGTPQLGRIQLLHQRQRPRHM
jgi:hypothetical protein